MVGTQYHNSTATRKKNEMRESDKTEKVKNDTILTIPLFNISNDAKK